MRLLAAFAAALLGVLVVSTGWIAEPPASGDALVVLLDAAPSTTDPRFATSDYDGKLSRLVYAGLVSFDTPDGRPEPALAASWRWESATRLRVRLREGIAFHDGTPITSADVVATWESLAHPDLASPIAASMRGVRLRAEGAREVVFELDAPNASFETRLDLGIVPAAEVARVQEPGADRPVIGSGPWRIEAWRPGGPIRLVPHAGWVPAPPEVAIEFRVIPDANTRLLTVLAGRADVVQNAIPPALLPVFEAGGVGRASNAPSPWVIAEQASFKYSYLVMNLDVPGLGDRRVREAIAWAIDRDAIIDSRLRGRAVRATGMLPPSHWAHAPGILDRGHDPERARALLDAAGWAPDPADGCRLRLTWKVSTNRMYRSMAEAMAGQLHDVGICVAVQAWEWGTFFEDVRRGRFELASLQWTSVLDPDIHRWTFHSESIPGEANGFAGANRGRYRSDEMDRLLDLARATVDPDERRALWVEVQTLAARDLPYVPLWHEDHVVVRSARAEGYEAVPTGRFGALIRVPALPAARRAHGR